MGNRRIGRASSKDTDMKGGAKSCFESICGVSGTCNSRLVALHTDVERAPLQAAAFQFNRELVHGRDARHEGDGEVPFASVLDIGSLELVAVVQNLRDQKVSTRAPLVAKLVEALNMGAETLVDEADATAEHQAGQILVWTRCLASNLRGGASVEDG